MTFRHPFDCIQTKCDVFVAIDTNAGDPDYLDVYLEGAAGGWVAVGFTETANMVGRQIATFSCVCKNTVEPPLFQTPLGRGLKCSE